MAPDNAAKPGGSGLYNRASAMNNAIRTTQESTESAAMTSNARPREAPFYVRGRSQSLTPLVGLTKNRHPLASYFVWGQHTWEGRTLYP
jgi:hypothetical protein